MRTLLSIGLLLSIACVSNATADIPDGLKFDCHPDQKETGDAVKQNCLSRGCSWAEVEPDTLTPWCFYPEDYANYRLAERKGQSLILDKSERASGFPDDVQRVQVDVIGVDDDKVRVRIFDPVRDRWEPPVPDLSHVASSSNRVAGTQAKYEVKIRTEESSILLSISRRSTGVTVFQTDLKRLIFSNQFIQLIFNVSTPALYGLGEHMSGHQKTVDPQETKRQQFRIMNHDDPEMSPQKSSYGSHPFYLMYEDGTDDAHGFLLINSNPLDIIFTHTPALTIRTIGGILDFFLFLGPSPVQVIRQKAELIGPAPLPPLWALGFHLCRYGYESAQEVNETYSTNIAAGVPLDVQWADIDYMDNCNMFTYDRDKFGALPDVINMIHSSGRHFVPILDPAVSATEKEGTEAYIAYKDGLDNNVYIKNTTNQLVQAKVWNEAVSIFPDFTNPNTTVWWKKQLKIFHDKIPFDGLWIDMNEPAVVEYSGQISGCPKDHPLDRPQFNPMYPTDLEHKTICMSSQQYLSTHYNLHNLFAYYEAKVTYETLATIRQKRPFLLSRATTTGQQIYSSHWTGDVFSIFPHLRTSVAGILDFNLFGVPLVGADICGFNGDTNEELCARWSSVGAFYSFARNHNGLHQKRQDPAYMQGAVLTSAKNALTTRYQLLPYLYTLFYQNTKYGDPVLRSLKMNYPHDQKVNGNDFQFMWGTDLLISPILDQGKTDLDAYFPAGAWYDLPTRTLLRNATTGGFVPLNLPLTEIGLAFRGGSVIPTHDPKLSTTEQRSTPFNLIAWLDSKEEASGQLYWDDGDSLNTLEFEEYTHVQFTVAAKTLTSKPIVTGFKGEKKGDEILPVMRLKKVLIVAGSKWTQRPVVTFRVKRGGEKKFYASTITDNVLSIYEEDGIVMDLLQEFQISWK